MKTSQKDVYIFRHPFLKVRKEVFGGLAQADGGLYMLGHNEFDALVHFQGYINLLEAKNKLGHILLKNFLKAGFLLKINQKDANNALTLQRKEVKKDDPDSSV